MSAGEEQNVVVSTRMVSVLLRTHSGFCDFSDDPDWLMPWTSPRSIASEIAVVEG